MGILPYQVEEVAFLAFPVEVVAYLVILEEEVAYLAFQVVVELQEFLVVEVEVAVAVVEAVLHIIPVQDVSQHYLNQLFNLL